VRKYPQNGVISEVKKGTIMHPNGVVEERKHELIIVLDDGTSNGSVTICQNCEGTVSTASIRRCGYCMKTCCISQNCAKGSISRNVYFCCRWHWFLWLIIPGRRVHYVSTRNSTNSNVVQHTAE
jgi:hypothetical protein